LKITESGQNRGRDHNRLRRLWCRDLAVIAPKAGIAVRAVQSNNQSNHRALQFFAFLDLVSKRPLPSVIQLFVDRKKVAQKEFVKH